MSLHGRQCVGARGEVRDPPLRLLACTVQGMRHYTSWPTKFLPNLNSLRECIRCRCFLAWINTHSLQPDDPFPPQLASSARRVSCPWRGSCFLTVMGLRIWLTLPLPRPDRGSLGSTSDRCVWTSAPRQVGQMTEAPTTQEIPAETCPPHPRLPKYVRTCSF